MQEELNKAQLKARNVKNIFSTKKLIMFCGLYSVHVHIPYTLYLIPYTLYLIPYTKVTPSPFHFVYLNCRFFNCMQKSVLSGTSDSINSDLDF